MSKLAVTHVMKWIDFWINWRFFTGGVHYRRWMDWLWGNLKLAVRWLPGKKEKREREKWELVAEKVKQTKWKCQFAGWIHSLSLTSWKLVNILSLWQFYPCISLLRWDETSWNWKWEREIEIDKKVIVCSFLLFCCCWNYSVCKCASCVRFIALLIFTSPKPIFSLLDLSP